MVNALGVALALAFAQPPATADSAVVAAWLAQVRASATPPESLIVAAFQTHHLVFLGDVHPAAEPKRLVARLVPVLKAQDRLDVLALEVPLEQQPVIDAYLASDPEDVTILTDHPLTLRAHWGASREYLEMYRTVWSVNRELAPDARIRIVAVDAPRGPPQGASERDAVARFARRDAVMASRISREILAQAPDAYVLLFLGGYHGLEGMEGEVEWNGERARVRWLAGRLAGARPEGVYTILTDGAPAAASYATGSSLGATRWFDWVRERLGGVVAAPFAVPVTPLFDAAVPGALLWPLEGPISLRFLPRDYALAAAVDAYLYLGAAEPITPLDPRRPPP